MLVFINNLFHKDNKGSQHLVGTEVALSELLADRVFDQVVKDRKFHLEASLRRLQLNFDLLSGDVTVLDRRHVAKNPADVLQHALAILLELRLQVNLKNIAR